MGAKASRTEKHILAKAREIFSKKGFKNVTMQDIVDACDISRGGLYLHFSSVEDIFLVVLKAEDSIGSDNEASSENVEGEGDYLVSALNFLHLTDLQLSRRSRNALSFAEKTVLVLLLWNIILVTIHPLTTIILRVVLTIAFTPSKRLFLMVL